MLQLKLPAVIFDLDGTLIDSLADIAAAMNRALARFGLAPHPEGDYRTFVGEGVEKLTERAVPEKHRALRPEVMAEYRKDYAAHALGATRLYAGISELLDALSERGTPLAILSNKPQAPTEELARTLLGRWRFRSVLGERDGVARKPHPGAALETARALQTPPGACFFVGDTAIDMRTAAAAGMVAAGVLWGFRGRAELEGAGARHLLSEPGQLLPLLGA